MGLFLGRQDEMRLALVVRGGILGDVALIAAGRFVKQGEQIRQFLGSIVLAGCTTNLFQAGANGGTDGAVDESRFFGGLDSFFCGFMVGQKLLRIKKWEA